MRSLVSSRALRMMIPRERSPESARQSSPAVDTRHHQVEHDEVRLELVDDPERDVSIRRGADVVSLVAQAKRDEVGDALLVVDDEDAGRPTHCFEYMSRLADNSATR